ncbi:MAG: DUF1249 domain-containing protein [Gammaproteobacteria bacterium]|nr:DUF1249 domain-containing protein [Gammaproteobacteria bacterium]
MNTIYESMHRKLMRLLPGLPDIAEHATLKAEGFMDLNVDILNRTDTYTDLALSHYYRHPSGDMIADPDMEIRVWNHGAVEALSFQDSFGYRVVYHDDGNRRLVDPRAKRDLNAFLNTWLSNLLAQGHRIVQKDGA